MKDCQWRWVDEDGSRHAIELRPDIYGPYTVFHNVHPEEKPLVLEYDASETTRPLLEDMVLVVSVDSHDWEDLELGAMLHWFTIVMCIVGALLGTITWAIRARMTKSSAGSPA